MRSSHESAGDRRSRGGRPPAAALPGWQVQAPGVLVPFPRESAEDSCQLTCPFAGDPPPSRPPPAPAHTHWARHSPPPSPGGTTRAAPRPIRSEPRCKLSPVRPAAAALLPDQDARAAWRRRVAYAGSLFQLAFAALWLVRGTLAAGWPARLPIAIALAAAAAGAGIWGALATRGLAPQPRGQAAARLGRAITTATVAQLAASIALPVILSAAGRPDLAVTSIAITIGILLLWLRARLAAAGHLAAGVPAHRRPGLPRPGADREHPHRRHRAGHRRHPPGQRHHRIPRPGQRRPHHPRTRQPAPGIRPARGSRPRGCRGIRTAPRS